MKKRKKKRFILIVPIIVIIFFLLYFFINDKSKNNILTNSLKDLTAGISKITIKNKSDNKILVDEINKDYEKEIENLKKILELNKLNSTKKFINSTVIKRSANKWYDIITIDKGKKDGIKEGLAVINSEGVIGKVIDVNYYSSDVKLIISSNKDSYISAGFSYENNDYYGLISEYNMNKNELKLKNIVGDFNKEKLKGTNVTTSGLTDSFTSGLIIGKIKDIKKDTFGISNTIIITPTVNFSNINIVTVVVGDK